MTTSERVIHGPTGEAIRCAKFLHRTPQGEYRYAVTLESGLVVVDDFSESFILDATLRLKCHTTARKNSLPEDSDIRNSYPMADGLLDYFPNALAEVSRVSKIGNEKHNPGEPMHHARGKSTDHRNKMMRHLIDAGGFEEVEVNGKIERVRHSAYLAWRALANLQEELEREEGYPLARGAKE
jgi:hypothetical protein